MPLARCTSSFPTICGGVMSAPSLLHVGKMAFQALLHFTSSLRCYSVCHVRLHKHLLTAVVHSKTKRWFGESSVSFRDLVIYVRSSVFIGDAEDDFFLRQPYCS